MCLTLCNSMDCRLPASYIHGTSQARILEWVSRRPWFDPWVGKIPWRREWLPTPVFWPGEFHGLYSPVISVQFSCSVMSNSLCTTWIAARQAALSITNSRSLLKLVSIESDTTERLSLSCSLFLLPGNLPDPGMEPTSLASPALAGGFCTTSGTWKAPYKRK